MARHHDRGPGPLRAARRHLHARGHVARGDGAPAATSTAIGVTAIEVMPVAEFPGRFGWGYDGVFPYAPTQLYGTPDDFRAFVDRAHELGLGVILDVVYNHLGPDGLRASASSPSSYFTQTVRQRVGRRAELRRPGRRRRCASTSRRTRRTGSTSSISTGCGSTRRRASTIDPREHIVAAVDDGTRAQAARRPRDHRRRRERDAGGSSCTRPSDGRLRPRRRVERRLPSQRRRGADRAARGVLLATIAARRRSSSRPRSTATCSRDSATRGRSSRAARRTDGLPPAAFVNFIENHDQVANSGDGSRLHRAASPGRYRAMTALLLLLPGTPMLFQGQEFGASSPFLYFADHEAELAAGRARRDARSSSRSFRACASPEAQARLPAPHDPGDVRALQAAMGRARRARRRIAGCTQDLLALRRERRGVPQQAAGRRRRRRARPTRRSCCGIDAATPDDERLLVVNFGADLVAGVVRRAAGGAAATDHVWRVRWSSEDPAYGGVGGARGRDARTAGAFRGIRRRCWRHGGGDRCRSLERLTRNWCDACAGSRPTKGGSRSRGRNGSSPTGSAATPPAPSPAR